MQTSLSALHLWLFQVCQGKPSGRTKRRSVWCQKCETFLFVLHWAVKWSGRMHEPPQGPQPTTCTAPRHKQDKRERERESGSGFLHHLFSLSLLFFFFFAMQMIIKKHWSASLCCDTSIYHQGAAFTLWLNSMTNHQPLILKTCKLFNLCKTN